MTNSYYNHTDGVPVPNSRGITSVISNEFDLIAAGFDIANNYAVDTGTTNAFVVTVPAALTSLTDGLKFSVKALNATTGASTLTAGTFAAKAIKMPDGSATLANSIYANQEFEVRYNLAQDYYQLLGTPVSVAANGLPLTGGTMTGPINQNHGTTIASAATVNLQTATGNFVHISGTTNITAITLNDGAERAVVFDGILTLTHNATTLILPGAANILTAAGDTMTVRGDGAGNARIISYTKASGGQLGFDAEVTIASASTVNIGAAASTSIIISGTATITAFDTVADGIVRRVTFSGALTLTHNGTSLILPGAVSIATAAGDTAEFLSLGAGNWRCLRYTRANGRGVIASSGGASVNVPLSGNLTLTNASKQLQTFSPNAAGLTINLPDATTMPDLGQMFTLKHVTTSGFFPAPILDNAGTQIGVSIPGATTNMYLEVNGTAAGTWRICTGDLSRDNGLAWWGNVAQTLGAVVAAGTDTRMFSFAITTRYGVIGWDDGTNVLVQGYDLNDGNIILGATSQLVAAGHLATTAQNIDGCALSATRLFVVYNTTAPAVIVRTIDINTSTLALTLNSTATITSAASDGVPSCDVISSTLAFISWNSGVPNCLSSTVSVNAGTGACTANASSEIGSGLNPIFSSCAVLSSTLAHVLHADDYNGTNLKVTRVALSGTTATAGTPVAISSRRPLSTSAIANTSNAALCVIPLTATTSYTVLQNSNSLLFGEVFTDTGSTITTTETALTSGEAGSGAYAQACSLVKSQNSARGLLYNMWSAGGSFASTIETWATVNAVGTAVTLSPTLPAPTNIAQIPNFSATVIQQYPFHQARLFKGIGVIPFGKLSTPKLFVQAVACA